MAQYTLQAGRGIVLDGVHLGNFDKRNIDPTSADALVKRIVLCLNACRDIPDAALDGFSIRGFVENIDESVKPEDLSAPVNAAINNILGH